MKKLTRGQAAALLAAAEEKLHNDTSPQLVRAAQKLREDLQRITPRVRHYTCPACGGQGAYGNSVTGQVECAECRGTGTVRRMVTTHV